MDQLCAHCQREESSVSRKPQKIEQEAAAITVNNTVVTNSSNLQSSKPSRCHTVCHLVLFTAMPRFLHPNAGEGEYSPDFGIPREIPAVSSFSISNPESQTFHGGRKTQLFWGSSQSTLPFVPERCLDKSWRVGLRPCRVLPNHGLRAFVSLNTALWKQTRSWPQHPAPGFDLRLLGPLMSVDESQSCGIIKSLFYIIRSLWLLNYTL